MAQGSGTVAPKCPQRVERGSGPAFPCSFAAAHSGPCMAYEVPSSVAERRTWERENKGAEEIDPALRPPKAETFAERNHYGETPTMVVEPSGNLVEAAPQPGKAAPKKVKPSAPQPDSDGLASVSAALDSLESLESLDAEEVMRQSFEDAEQLTSRDADIEALVQVMARIQERQDRLEIALRRIIRSFGQTARLQSEALDYADEAFEEDDEQPEGDSEC